MFSASVMDDFDPYISFHIESEKEMLALGHAFAQAIAPENDPVFNLIRIGLFSDGETNVGKTTFFQGVLSYFIDITRREINNAGPIARKIDDELTISQFDARAETEQRPFHDDEPVVHAIFIEHPEEEEHDLHISIRVQVNPDQSRTVSFMCEEDHESEAGFQEFIRQANAHPRLNLV